ncbi:MAG: hypothetical protein KAX28_13355, partial [Candidatus Marinimicrobia bacterium]|nr:hypothetical protein [Candidatus Neomarinimicrobiota bacterium]
DVESEHEKLTSIYRKQQISLVAAGLIWAYNIFDAYFFVPKVEEKKQNFSLNSTSLKHEVKFEFSYHF